MDRARTLDAARGIAAQGRKISYPSSGVSEHVRSVVRDLLIIISQLENKPMRDIAEAAKRLKDASPEEIQLIAAHDWDMIREVAAVAFASHVASSAIPKAKD